MSTAIYARVSTESEDQAHALEQQLHRLRSMAADIGEPMLEFVDVASGTRDDRPQLRRLLDACEAGGIKTVLCTRLDRMSRSTVHGGKLLRLFNQASWPNLICLDQPIDLSTATGRFYASLLMGMAQMESELIGERVHHGQVYARTQLKPQAGKPPFGYRYTEGKANYALDPKTSKAARKIVQRLLETQSLADAFTFQSQELGMPFRSREGLRRWLMNPAIAGHRVYGTCSWSETADGGKKRRLNRPGEVEEILPNTHPALVSQEQYAAIVSVIQSLSHRQLTQVRQRRARVLTGLVYCGHCGRKMRFHWPGKHGPVYLRCGHELCPRKPQNSIQEKKVVDAVLQRLWKERDVLAAAGVVAELNQRDQISPEAVALAKQIQELERLHDPELGEVLEHKRLRLEQQLQECAAKGSRFQLQEAAAALDRPEVWEDLTATPERQRQLFCQWIERVVVTGKEVSEIRLSIGEAPATAS